jgi:hypothetical protein
MTQSSGIIVGCDRNQEWLLPWWWEHYSLQNAYPVLFVDFGMSEKAVHWCQQRGTYTLLKQETASVFFKKPLALLQSSFSSALWIDLDCQINGPLDPLLYTIAFGIEIALVREDESVHRRDRKSGRLLSDEISYNTGVIAFRQGAPVLRFWENMPGNYLDDQYALARAIYLHKPQPLELPSIYNWPNDHGPNEKAIIRHFHGPHGKLEILKQLVLLKHIVDEPAT